MTSESNQEGSGNRPITAPKGGTGGVSTAANNLDTERGASTKNVMGKGGNAVEHPDTDERRASWTSNILSSGKFGGLENQKHTGPLAPAADKVLEHRPGGADTLTKK